MEPYILLGIVLLGMFFWSRKIRKWLFIGIVAMIVLVVLSQTSIVIQN